MHVTRYNSASTYDAKGHTNMVGFRLQGFEVSPTKNFWVGLSLFLPGGGADSSASMAEKVYFVVSGEVTIVTDAGETTLGPNDSCHLVGGERRSIINKTNTPASMLVVMSYPPATP